MRQIAYVLGCVYLYVGSADLYPMLYIDISKSPSKVVLSHSEIDPSW